MVSSRQTRRRSRVKPAAASVQHKTSITKEMEIKPNSDDIHLLSPKMAASYPNRIMYWRKCLKKKVSFCIF